MQSFSKPLTVPAGQSTLKPSEARPPVQLIPGYRRPPPRKNAPTRRHWTEFPEVYLERLQQTRHALPITMGPMSWNDARFVQRDLRYFFRALGHDIEARDLYRLAKRLRISCPRCEDNPDMHWVILKLNPLA